MAFEFGMFHEFQCPAGKSQPEAFAESFEQVEAAERWGLDAMWLAENHVAPDRSVRPAPVSIARGIAANSPDTFPAIGKLGHGVFVAVRLGTLSELAPNIKAYREGWKEGGHPGQGQVFLRAPVYVAETAAQARSEPEESIMYFYRYLGERLEDSATRAGVRAIEDRAARGRRLQTITYDEALRDKIIVGTPEQVTDRLMGLKEELGLDGILAGMKCGTKIPHYRVMKSLQLLCEKVKPRFH